MWVVSGVLGLIILGFLFDEAVHATLGRAHAEADSAFFKALIRYMAKRFFDLPNAVLASTRILVLESRINALIIKRNAQNKGGRYGNKSV